MKIATVRRISQIFFFSLFIWFCIVNTLGESFWQLRGWPVNIFLQLDALSAIGTVLSTHRLYYNFIWAVLVIALTFVIGRFFCGWICPFGALHQFSGYIAHGKKPKREKIRLNSYRKIYVIKYYILILFLVMAVFPVSGGSLMTGLLDPLPLFTRSMNLVLLPVLDGSWHVTSAAGRWYEEGLFILIVFAALVLLNLVIPRFFCRVLCPLGALMAIFSRLAIWKIGQNKNACTECGLCDSSCEGGCEPSGQIRQAECVLCFNCLHDCQHGTISYQATASMAGEIKGPGISRKSFLTTLGSGIFIFPAMRLAGQTDNNWQPDCIRPPGSIGEEEFLARCLRCGQCMRICPTNIIQPAGLDRGIESLWTPVLNFRIGTSGCQHTCVACGKTCPTAAIRPITLEEKHGKGDYRTKGPLRIGTAFFDRSRCLPWAMNMPCIVCQENCPVSPKAIYTDEFFSPVREGVLKVKNIMSNTIELQSGILKEGMYSSGDYFILLGGRKYRIKGNGTGEIETTEKIYNGNYSTAEVLVHLQRPYMDIEKCVGCGICEHECPVHGLKAVRITAEGETRNPERNMTIRKGNV